MINHSKLVALVATTLVSSIAAQGVIRLNAAGNDNTLVQRADPIVTPGGLSQHSHDFFGSSGMNPGQTYDEITKGNCTTVIDADGFEVTPDKSVYWYPSLLMKKKGGTGYIRVPTIGRTIYYKDIGEGPRAEPFEFKPGFAMIGGDPYIREPFAEGDSRALHVEFNCGNVGRGVMPAFQKNFAGDCGDYPGYFATLHFPHCTNGDDFNVKEPNAHMAYPEGDPQFGACPSSHPTRLPHIELQIHWHLKAVLDKVEPDSFIMAHGDETGLGMHADFQSGWTEGVLPTLIDAGVSGQEFDVGVIRKARPDLLPATTAKGANCQLPPADYVEEQEELEEFLCGCNLPAATTNDAPHYGILPVGQSRGDCDVNPVKPVSSAVSSVVAPAATDLAPEYVANPAQKKRNALSHAHKHAHAARHLTAH